MLGFEVENVDERENLLPKVVERNFYGSRGAG